MQYIVIPTVALVASGLTLFSGFGLGTLLMPAFAFFFPVDLAIALTAIVAALAADHAGFGPVMNYDLSFGDWAADATCPLEKIEP